MTKIMPVLFLAAAFVLTGCGRRDPVQLELREYQRTVISPLTEDEERFQAELAQAEEAHPRGELSREVTLPLFRDRLLPIYEGILARARAHRPRAAALAKLHAELVQFYEIGVGDLKKCTDALAASDDLTLAAAQQAMMGRDPDGLTGRLERLYARHKLSIE